MKKLFVWDFHGTLEKGNEFAALDISDRALKKHGFPERFTEQQGNELYGKKWYEYFEYILPNEPHDVHVMLQQTCFEWPEAEVIVAEYIQPNDHAAEVLRAIQAAGHSQILISNTSVEALPIFVAHAKLTDFFNAANSFAVMAHSKEVKRTKLDVLEEFIKAAAPHQSVIVIGDSPKDMDLAKHVKGVGYFYRHPGRELEFPKKTNIVQITDLRKVLAEV